MKSTIISLAVVGMVSQVDAFEFAGMEIPRTKKEALAKMKIPKYAHAEPEASARVLAKAHKHTLRATNHREILGEKMGLAPRTPYYELMHTGSSHSMFA